METKDYQVLHVKRNKRKIWYDCQSDNFPYNIFLVVFFSEKKPDVIITSY